VRGVLVDAQGRRWSDPQVVYDFRQIREIETGPGWSLTDLRVAPTGDWLSAVVSYYESGQVWLLDLSSGEAHPVSECRQYRLCTVRDWSPDGRAIILELYPFRADPREFVMVDVATDTATELHAPKTTLGSSSVDDAFFSPDGHSIMWTIRGGGDDGETTQMWLTDSKGEQAQLLISETGLIWNASLSPDGSQIAYTFAPGRQQKASVRLLSVGHQESGPLVPSPDVFRNPAWSPDGLQVAITHCADVPPRTSLADQQCNVSVLERRNGLISPIVTLPGRTYWDFSWSPDGGLLAFLSAGDDDLQAVWLFSSETGESYPISGYSRSFSEYAWLPYSFLSER
jgi:Tol biopolymer transport system component